MDDNIIAKPRKQLIRKASYSEDEDDNEDYCEVNKFNAYSTSQTTFADDILECKKEESLLITEEINTTAPTSTVETVVQEVSVQPSQPTSPPTGQPSGYKGAQTVEFEGIKKPIIDRIYSAFFHFHFHFSFHFYFCYLFNS
jgi:hypothetical protein